MTQPNGVLVARSREGRRVVLSLGTLAVLGAVASAVLVLMLAVFASTVSGVDPLRRTISEYGLTADAVVFNTAVVALAAGCLALYGALLVRGDFRGVSVASVLWLLGTFALLVLVVYPKHNWAIGPSTSGQVHRVASLVAFLALPVAVLLVARRGLRGPRRGAAWAALLLAVGSLAWFGVILGAVALRPVTGLPWWQTIPLGLVERGVAGFEVAAVVALAVWAARRTDEPSGGLVRPG